MTVRKRRILLIGTGGTIAGASPADDPGRYQPGAIGIEQLIANAPGLAGRFAITSEQPFSIGSQHFTTPQLKGIQEALSILTFFIVSTFLLGEPITLKQLAGFGEQLLGIDR